MAEPDNLVLVYLRRIDQKVDRLIDNEQDLKIRMTDCEERLAKVELSIAGINRRCDRIEARLDRIERRFDLADAPH